MPTYDYQCSKCGKTFELFQSIKAAPLRRVRCEHCESVVPVKRLIGSGGAILFKGSGFYETDYRRAGAKKPTESEKDNAPAGDTKSKDIEAKSKENENKSKDSDTKSATSSETKPAKDTSPAKTDKKKKE